MLCIINSGWDTMPLSGKRIRKTKEKKKKNKKRKKKKDIPLLTNYHILSHPSYPSFGFTNPRKELEMQENLIKTILGFYDQNGEFQKNDRYSDRYQSVYTKSDDNSHWLVAIPNDNNRLEIHQTDEHGVIITRDTYESKGNTVPSVP